MVTTNLNPLARASAVNVAYQQQTQNVGADARPEKILVIGNYQDGKTGIITNTPILSSGNADDIGTQFGYGSPLHRQARKLFPTNGNGSKVDTYFMAVAGPGTGAKHALTLGASGEPTSNFVAYFRYKELEFEAAADVAGKIATNAQSNPAKDPRGIALDIFNRESIPFTVLKGMTVEAILTSLLSELNENPEIPFTAALSTEKTTLVLTSKWSGSTSAFEVDFVNANGDAIKTTDYGIAFTSTITAPGAGLVDISKALESITEEMGITRVVCQFNDTAALDAMQEYFEALRDGLIAQYVLCYTGMAYSESSTVAGTVDAIALIAIGTARRLDAVNVLICGDYHKHLRTLKYANRDTLLKAGISNLEPQIDGSYTIGDLCTFFHPLGNKNPLYKFDRNITVIANTAYDLMQTFRYGEDWKSIIIVADSDTTGNPAARKLKDIKAAVNTRISLWGKAGWVADVATSQKNTVVEIDSSNPDRLNINASWFLSGVGRIFDLVNFVGFYFG